MSSYFFLQLRSNRYYVLYYILVITQNIVAAAPLVCGVAHKNVKSVHKIFKTNVSESLISLTKNEQISESLIFLSESLICSFLGKKRAIRLKTNERIPSPVQNAYSFDQEKQVLPIFRQ